MDYRAYLSKVIFSRLKNSRQKVNPGFFYKDIPLYVYMYNIACVLDSWFPQTHIDDNDGFKFPLSLEFEQACLFCRNSFFYNSCLCGAVFPNFTSIISALNLENVGLVKLRWARQTWKQQRTPL